MGYRTRMQIAAGAGARCFHSNRVSRTLIGAALVLVATVVGLVPSPAASTALSKPARPAVAGSNTALSVAAAEALAALWARDDTYADKLAVVVPLVAVAGEVSAGRLADAWSTASRQRMVLSVRSSGARRSTAQRITPITISAVAVSNGARKADSA